MTPTERIIMQNKLAMYQVDVIQDLSHRELYHLVMDGFPSYRTMPDEQLKKEYDEIFGETENRPHWKPQGNVSANWNEVA